MKLTTEVELAELFGLAPEKIARKRRREHWPHVDMGRFDKRYTDEQIAQIVAMKSVTAQSSARPPSEELPVIEGLTKRAAARRGLRT